MDLESKTIRMRLVEEADAEFILKLRMDRKYNKFLSQVRQSVADQKKWIKDYKNKEERGEQYYFIIENKEKGPCGTVRIYDLKEDSFCWGSWILNNQKTRYAALESAFLVYDFGFSSLGYQCSRFDVMKGNTSVIDFHRKMGAVETSEDENNIYFKISRASVEETKLRLRNKVLS